MPRTAKEQIPQHISSQLQITAHDFQHVEKLLSGWIPTQRWYVRTESDSAETKLHPFTIIHTRFLSPDHHESQTFGSTFLAIVADTSRDIGSPRSTGTYTYAVPLYCEQALPSSAHACGFIGTITLSDGSQADIYDAAEHPHGQRTLLAAALGKSGAQLPAVSSAKKLTSEQSNTSIIYELCTDDIAHGTPASAAAPTADTAAAASTAPAPAGIILKILRIVHDGRNPDVELETALDHSLSAQDHSIQLVPRQYGHLTVSFTPSASETSSTIHTDIAVAAEFLAGSTDGWQVVTEELTRTGSSPLVRIEELGSLTKAIHCALADALPVTPPISEARTMQLKSWRTRAAAALERVSELAQHAEAIEQIFTSAVHSEWPDLQRIHGDYHLGQVLLTRQEQWRAIDFEGEPLRPLSERRAPDLALRDVAGMLRSLSYAAGYARMHTESALSVTHSIDAWESAAHTAFLKGYGECEYPLLLQALMLDKALYEVAYEAAYRPDWLSIPLHGVTHALASANF